MAHVASAGIAASNAAPPAGSPSDVLRSCQELRPRARWAHYKTVVLFIIYSILWYGIAQ